MEGYPGTTNLVLCEPCYGIYQSERIAKLEEELDGALRCQKVLYKRMDRAIALMGGYDPNKEWDRLVGEMLATIKVNLKRGHLVVASKKGKRHWDAMLANWKERREVYKQ